jgi:hypothetical protein
MKHARKSFLALLGGAALALALAGCGGSYGGSKPQPMPGPGPYGTSHVAQATQPGSSATGR